MMGTGERLDESISRWLEETAPRGIPGRVLEATFERTRGSRQQVGWRGLLGGSHMTHFGPVLGGVAAVVVVAAALALGSFGDGPASGGLPAPSPSATASPSTSPAATASPSTSPAATASPSTSPRPTAPPLEAKVTKLLSGFLEARVAGEGAQQYLNPPEEDIPLLYATTSGAPYERAEFEQVLGYEWPYEWTAFTVRLFAGDTVVEQLFFTPTGLGLEYEKDGFGTDIAPTTEDGQPVAAPYTYFDGEVTLQAAHPWIFHSGWAAGRLIPEGPGVQPTTDGGERNGWDTLVLNVGWHGPPSCQASVCDVRVDGGAAIRQQRYYRIDAPEGSSMQTLTLVLSASESGFERAVAAAAPLVDSIEFRVP